MGAILASQRRARWRSELRARGSSSTGLQTALLVAAGIAFAGAVSWPRSSGRFATWRATPSSEAAAWDGRGRRGSRRPSAGRTARRRLRGSSRGQLPRHDDRGDRARGRCHRADPLPPLRLEAGALTSRASTKRGRACARVGGARSRTSRTRRLAAADGRGVPRAPASRSACCSRACGCRRSRRQARIARDRRLPAPAPRRGPRLRRVGRRARQASGSRRRSATRPARRGSSSRWPAAHRRRRPPRRATSQDQGRAASRMTGAPPPRAKRALRATGAAPAQYAPGKRAALSRERVEPPAAASGGSFPGVRRGAAGDAPNRLCGPAAPWRAVPGGAPLAIRPGVRPLQVDSL